MKRFGPLFMTFAVIGLIGITGCRPKTTAEKAEDKMEDAAHDAGQGVERAGERIQKRLD